MIANKHMQWNGRGDFVQDVKGRGEVRGEERGRLAGGGLIGLKANSRKTRCHRETSRRVIWFVRGLQLQLLDPTPFCTKCMKNAVSDESVYIIRVGQRARKGQQSYTGQEEIIVSMNSKISTMIKWNCAVKRKQSKVHGSRLVLKPLRTFSPSMRI